MITGNYNSPARLVEFAKAAEDSGFEHLLLSDHYHLDESPDMLDSWAVIGHLTGVTSTLRLGTCVTPITFRPPLQLAKIVTTLDHLSKGRIIMGVGAGWDRTEFEMFSHYYPNRERFAQFKESLDLLTQAWTNGKVSFSGKYYTVKGAVVEPKPVQKPMPPLLFGGWGKQMVKLAGERGDGWTPTGPRSGEAVKTPAYYAEFVRLIERGLKARGRSHDDFSFGCRFGLFKDPKQHLPEIQSFEAAGLNFYQIAAWGDEHSGGDLKNFGDSVIETT